MLALRRLRPAFAYHWLVAAGGAFLAWAAVWALWPRLPLTLPLFAWGPPELLFESPRLAADPTSWPFALALATLTLSVILTDVGRAAEARWSSWAGSLALGALGVLAVLAGNPLTLALAWSVIDFVELAVLLGRVEPEARPRAVTSFATSLVGTMFLLMAAIWTNGQNIPFGFDVILPAPSVLLVLAVGLRLGVLPLQAPLLQEPALRRGLGSMVRLVPPAASLVLLVRVAEVGVFAQALPYLLALVLLAALYAGSAWALAADEITGRPFWILAMTALATAAALRGAPFAALAWSLALLYGGGVLFLASARERALIPLAVLASFTLLALPFSPALSGAQMFSPFHPLTAALVIPYAFILAGYLRHLLRPTERFVGLERWVWVVYPLGLLLLPLTFIVAGLLLSSRDAAAPIIWPGLAGIVLSAILAVAYRRGWRVGTPALQIMDAVFSFKWLYVLARRVYGLLGRFVSLFAGLLEGQGGVLWALLLVALLATVVVQLAGGGG